MVKVNLRVSRFNFNIEVTELYDEVIMIKLAERLHNMRTFEYMEEDIQKVKAKETIDIFMPLARKLNNEKLINELKDLSLRFC